MLALMGGVCRSSILERADSVALLQHHSRIIEQKYSHSIMDTRSMSSYARPEEKHNCKGKPLGPPAQEMVIFLGACSAAARG